MNSRLVVAALAAVLGVGGLVAYAVVSPAPAATAPPVFTAAPCTSTTAACTRSHVATVEQFLSSLYPAPTPPATTPPASSTPATTPPPTSSPPSAGFPDASNTGVPVGTALTVVNGSYTVPAGATATGLDVSGSVILGAGAKLTNSRVRCINVSDWCMELNGQNTVSDSEIGGGANGTTYGPGNAFWSGGSNAGNLFQRVNIHNTQDGGRVDGGTTMVDSWVHAMPTGDQPIPTAHGDGVQVTSGGNITYRHNTVEGGNNDSFFVQFSGAEPIGNITVDNCLLIGVSRNGQISSYGVSIENKNIAASAVLNVTNNQFAGTFQVGPVNVPAKATVTGNTYQATGQPVPIYRN